MTDDTRGDGGVGRVPRARPEVVFRSVAEDWVLYDPRNRDLHVLNATAAAVWSCCDGTLDEEGIVGELMEHLEGAPDPETVRADVREALERFRSEGLLE